MFRTLFLILNRLMRVYYACWCWGVSSKDVTVAAQMHIVHMPEMIIWLEGRYGLRLKYFHDKFRFDPKSRYSQNATDDEDGQTCDVLWSFQTGEENIGGFMQTDKHREKTGRPISGNLFSPFYGSVVPQSILG